MNGFEPVRTVQLSAPESWEAGFFAKTSAAPRGCGGQFCPKSAPIKNQETRWRKPWPCSLGRGKERAILCSRRGSTNMPPQTTHYI